MDSIRIRLDLAYDGTDFCGWQIQKEGRTVQGEIEAALQTLHKHSVRLTGSGRTDAGVHARFQVAHFDSDKVSMKDEQFALALNSLLPNDICIMKSRVVVSDFHSRFDAVERGYRYYLLPKRKALPFEKRFCYETRREHDFELLNHYASFLIGYHDFSSFASTRDISLSKMRVVTSASFMPEGEFFVFRISGNAFLWKMIRTIVGTLLDLEKERAPAERVKEILDLKNRVFCGTTAPPQGLFLDFVRYPGEPGGTGFEYNLGMGKTVEGAENG